MAPSKPKKAEAEERRTLADLGESDAPGFGPGGELRVVSEDEVDEPMIVDEDHFEDDYADLDDED